jgi:hypothetical protein
MVEAPDDWGENCALRAIRDTPSTAVYPSAAAELGACRCRQPRASKRHSRLFGGSEKRCTVQPPRGAFSKPRYIKTGRTIDAATRIYCRSRRGGGRRGLSIQSDLSATIGAVANRAVPFRPNSAMDPNPIWVGARRTLHCVRLFACNQHQQKLFAARRWSRCQPLFDEAPATRSYGHHT